MKNGTTRMAYKAERAVDLKRVLIVSATVHHGNATDVATVIDTGIDAAVNLEHAGCENEVEAIVADTGYHSTTVAMQAAEFGMKSYIPERAQHEDDELAKIRAQRTLCTQRDGAPRLSMASCCREHAVSWSNAPSLMCVIPQARDGLGSAGFKA